jgi:hypothetical protein
MASLMRRILPLLAAPTAVAELLGNAATVVRGALPTAEPTRF